IGMPSGSLVFVGEGEVVPPGSCPGPLVGPFVAVAAALVAVGAVAPPKPDKAAAAPGTPSDRRLGLTYVAATSAPADAVPRPRAAGQTPRALLRMRQRGEESQPPSPPRIGWPQPSCSSRPKPGASPHLAPPHGAMPTESPGRDSVNAHSLRGRSGPG